MPQPWGCRSCRVTLSSRGRRPWAFAGRRYRGRRWRRCRGRRPWRTSRPGSPGAWPPSHGLPGSRSGRGLADLRHGIGQVRQAGAVQRRAGLPMKQPGREASAIKRFPRLKGRRFRVVRPPVFPKDIAAVENFFSPGTRVGIPRVFRPRWRGLRTVPWAGLPPARSGRAAGIALPLSRGDAGESGKTSASTPALSCGACDRFRTRRLRDGCVSSGPKPCRQPSASPSGSAAAAAGRRLPGIPKVRSSFILVLFPMPGTSSSQRLPCASCAWSAGR